MTIGVVILAAGSGKRAGSHIPKQYVPLNGEPIIRYSLDAFLRHPMISHVQPVIAAGDEAHFDAASRGLMLLPAVHGGATRQNSVFNGLKALEPYGLSHVLIHDGARPFVSQSLISQLIEKLKQGFKGAIPALAVSDTLKHVNDGAIERTIERNGLWAAQTPQAFSYLDIFEAHQKAQGQNLSDDAAIAEFAGLNIQICGGSSDNIKITNPEDFDRATKLLGISTRETRTGFGVDVHKLVKNTGQNGVTLCGVTLPHDKSLEGHSDADVAMHALTDALLGAMAEGDIGDHFPPSDEKWKGAPSDIFLKHAQKLLEGKQGKIINLDITIICETPKIAPFRQKMRQSISDILQISIDRVSIKATTSEKLGFMGRGEGILAQAVATITIPSL